MSLLDVQISLLTYMATMQTLSGIDPEANWKCAFCSCTLQ